MVQGTANSQRMASLQDEGEAGMPETRSCVESPAPRQKGQEGPKGEGGPPPARISCHDTATLTVK